MRNWGGAVEGQQAPVSSAVSKRRRFEAVSKVVQQLPIEVYAAKGDLQQLPLSDLKVRTCVLWLICSINSRPRIMLLWQWLSMFTQCRLWL